MVRLSLVVLLNCCCFVIVIVIVVIMLMLMLMLIVTAIIIYLVEYTRHSFGIVSEYLSPDLAEKLREKLNLPEPEKPSGKPTL